MHSQPKGHRQLREIGLETAETGKGEAFCPFFLFFFLRADGEETVVLRLDDRTLHVFAGGCFGTGLGGA